MLYGVGVMRGKEEEEEKEDEKNKISRSVFSPLRKVSKTYLAID